MPTSSSSPKIFDWTWKRHARYVVAFFALVVAFAAVNVWHYVDIGVYSFLSGSAQDRELLARLMPIDIGASPSPGRHAVSLRRPIVDLLKTIRCGHPLSPSGTCVATPSSGANRRTIRPQYVVLDIEFTADCADPSVPEKTLQTALLDTIQDGINVYGVEAPTTDEFGKPLSPADFESCSHRGQLAKPDNEIYDRGYISGTGHSLMKLLPRGFPQNIGWYATSLPGPSGSPLEALPLLLTRGEETQKPTSGWEPVIFGVGPLTAFSGGPEASLFRMSEVLAHPSLIDDKIAVIGNTPTEHRIGTENRTGFELLNWAISDKLRGHLAQRTNILLMLGVTVALSLLAVVAYQALFRALRTRRFCYTLAFGGAVALSLGALAALVGILFASGEVFAQVTLPSFAILAATGLTARWTADQVRHERFLHALPAAAPGEKEFDVFISYARDPENARWVEKEVYGPLSQATRANGRRLRIFFDRESITVGMDWYERIVSAIQGSRFFVPVYSRGYFDRWFCRDELEIALLQRRADPDFIVPLMRSPQQLPRRYRGIHYVDTTQDDRFIEELARVLGADDPPTKP